MRTLRIGKSSANDIVISDVRVSSNHAIITIHDSGEVKLKDLNSTNGTYVNGHRITIETSITANDVVKVGNIITVDWIKYLNAPKRPAYSPSNSVNESAILQRKTIGREVGDIVLGHDDVSSTHAQLIKKANGDIVIVDSGSTNGTYVNGKKVNMHTLQPGDSVLIAKKYPLRWEGVFQGINPLPPKPKPKPVKTVLIAALSAVAAAVVIILLLIGNDPKWTPEKIYATYKKSVVMIYGEYYYHVSSGNYDFGNFIIENNELVPDRVHSYGGTGFFVSQDGKIVTNKHVAVPWAYKQQEIELIRKKVQEYLILMASQSRAHQIEYLPLVNEVQVNGKQVTLGIVLNDTHLNNASDIIPCVFLKTTDNDEIDVAIIQTNSKSLPVGVEHIVDLNNTVVNNEDIKEGRSIYTIGFPLGVTIGKTSQGLEANNQSGEITQMRGDYAFGHNITIEHGASGSPVFNEYGQLIGVVNAGFFGISQGYNMAIKAKYAVELVK
ncbi:MAG: FHA domain-containing protein [Tannerella sp.]|jgi:pSer/pThr/pTyr-binding forkhead associated (FHA) protein/S1-C subfamily serine protease|nr:FHA domain-containing protein [Tannerella sp.]